MKSLLLSTAIVIAFASCTQNQPKQTAPAVPQLSLSEHAGSVPLMDETPYKSAMGDDSTQVAFYGKGDQFYAAYTGMLQDMASFLKKNNFKWEKETHYFNRVYFNADGTIDYYFYNFRGGISAEKEKQFNTLVKQFVKTYKLPMTATTKFVQCSPVNISDS